MADTLNDYMYQYYQRLVTGNAALSGAINVSRAAVGVEATTSVTGDGTVAAPAADAQIAATPDLSSGTWEITVYAGITGTAAVADFNNMKFCIGVTPIVTIPCAVESDGITTFNIRVNIGGATPMRVIADNAATAGTSYTASIIASKIGF